MLKLLTLLIIGYACAAPADNAAHSTKTAAVETQKVDVASDLNTDASSYYDRYSDFGSRSYPYGTGGYSSGGVTGYGSGGYTGGYGGSGLTGYGSGGYGTGGIAGYGSGGYGSGGVTGYGTIDDRYNVGASDNYGFDRGYGSGGYTGYDGNRGGYGVGGASYSGYGGYGGNGGNGGINSYYGYNNPSYQGYGHTGYGYYNRRPSYGNIYNGGITPSLVTGYRGYSRK